MKRDPLGSLPQGLIRDAQGPPWVTGTSAGRAGPGRLVSQQGLRGSRNCGASGAILDQTFG